MGAYIVGGDAGWRNCVRAICDDPCGSVPFARRANGTGRERRAAVPSRGLRRHGGLGVLGNLQLPFEAADDILQVVPEGVDGYWCKRIEEMLDTVDLKRI